MLNTRYAVDGRRGANVCSSSTVISIFRLVPVGRCIEDKTKLPQEKYLGVGQNFLIHTKCYYSTKFQQPLDNVVNPLWTTRVERATRNEGVHSQSVLLYLLTFKVDT